MHEAARDGAVSRLRAWRPRRPVDAAAPADPVSPVEPAAPRDAAAPAAPRVPEISALLADIDELRLVLSADLGLAASAVEVGALDIATDVLDGDRHELADFGARAARHLTGEPVAPVVPHTGPEGADVDGAEPADEVTPPGQEHPSRLGRRLLPLAPALAAAAALVGLLAGVVPTPSTSPATPTPVTTAAAASYAHLFRLHEAGAPVDRLREAHRRLHAELSRIVPLASADPVATEQAVRLLELELQVLDGSEHREQLLDAIAESRRLVAVLRAAMAGAPTGDLLAEQLPAATSPRPERSPARLPGPGGQRLTDSAAVPADEQEAATSPDGTAQPAEPAPAAPPPAEPEAAPESEAPEPSPTGSPTPARLPLFDGTDSFFP